MARFVTVAPTMSTAIPFVIGWNAMVTGQPIVLYSRLHLVITDKQRVRWVLWMIVCNFFVLNIPTTFLFFEVNVGHARFAHAAAIYDRIQLVGFCIQDYIICSIYIHEALRAFRIVFEMRGRDGRKVILQLIAINLIVVVLNTILIVTEFKLHLIQVSLKTVVYSIKLKLEFSILTRLRGLTRTNSCLCQDQLDSPRRSSDINIFDVVTAQFRTTPDIEAPAMSMEMSAPTRPSSIYNGTRDFHDALRETASTENMSSSLSSPATSVSYPASLSFSSDISPTHHCVGSRSTKSEICIVERPK
jgi:hypothetical protein